MAFIPGNGHHGDKQPLLGMETPPTALPLPQMSSGQPTVEASQLCATGGLSRYEISPERSAAQGEATWRGCLGLSPRSWSPESWLCPSTCRISGRYVICARMFPLMGTEMRSEDDDRESSPLESLTHVISAWETVKTYGCTAGYPTHPQAPASSCTARSCRIPPGHSREGQDRGLSLHENREKTDVVMQA